MLENLMWYLNLAINEVNHPQSISSHKKGTNLCRHGCIQQEHKKDICFFNSSMLEKVWCHRCFVASKQVDENFFWLQEGAASLSLTALDIVYVEKKNLHAWGLALLYTLVCLMTRRRRPRALRRSRFEEDIFVSLTFSHCHLLLSWYKTTKRCIFALPYKIQQ